MSPLPEAFAGRSPQPVIEAGGSGKPGKVAFLKVMKGWAQSIIRGVLTACLYVARDAFETVTAEPVGTGVNWGVGRK